MSRCAFLALLACLCSPHYILRAQAPTPAATDVVVLSGPGLSGLILESPDTVRQKNDTLEVADSAGWVRSRRTFRNFRLTFEAKLTPPTTRALVAIGGLPPGDGAPWVAYAVPVAGIQSLEPERLPGVSLYWFAMSAAGARAALRPPKDWQAYNIAARNGHLSVSVNRNVIIGDTMRVTEGWVGFRVVGGSMSVRGVRVTVLPDASSGQARVEPAYIGEIRRAAEAGDAGAQLRLGLAYARGERIAQDDTRGFVWMRRAAEQESREAQYAVAAFHLAGRGVPPSPAEAIRWFRRSADQGLPSAQDALGRQYLVGRNVPEDPALGFSWLHKAAEQGLAASQFTLGSLYAQGHGTEKDLVEGHKWLILAADASPDDSVAAVIAAREESAKAMTPDQIADAHKAAQAWTNAHPPPGRER